jgi:hypothetical protein
VVSFFILAGVGYGCDVPLLTCGLRALAGGAAMFVMAQVAGRIMIGIVADAMVRARNKDSGQ